METPPIVVDLINKTILRVGQDDKAQEKYEQIVAAQREAVTTAGLRPVDPGGGLGCARTC
jgi:hypothetical protein